MRRKIGTALHAHLVADLKRLAVEEGRSFNELLEQAIEAFLTRRRLKGGTVVDSSAGTYRVTDEQFRAVMDEELPHAGD
jgi:hypothetical protein